MSCELTYSGEIATVTMAGPKYDIDDVQWGSLGKFSPVNDLTPVESARLAAMFACAGKDWRFDLEGYVRKHNLMRHFSGQ